MLFRAGISDVKSHYPVRNFLNQSKDMQSCPGVCGVRYVISFV